jgi:hypothetical protein
MLLESGDDGHLRSCRRVVRGWLQAELGTAAAVTEVGADGLHASATPAQIEHAFGVRLQLYRRRTDGALARRARPGDSLRLPAAIARCVDAVSGVLVTELSAVPKSVLATSVRSAPPKDATTWPAMLSKLYGLPPTVANTGARPSRQATANFIGQYYEKSDLDAFFKQYHLRNISSICNLDCTAVD